MAIVQLLRRHAEPRRTGGDRTVASTAPLPRTSDARCWSAPGRNRTSGPFWGPVWNNTLRAMVNDLRFWERFARPHGRLHSFLSPRRILKNGALDARPFRRIGCRWLRLLTTR